MIAAGWALPSVSGNFLRGARGAVLRAFLLLATGLLLAACNTDSYGLKHLAPIPSALLAKMEEIGSDKAAPVYVRLFKEESILEVWKQTRNGTYALLKSYDICKWSGKLGPKIREGDRQAPEGFYVVTPAQMNPKSSYYLSFNIGYPNSFDRAHGRTGTYLMVHGACSSAGCYAMTDDQIREIYAIAREAFNGGQRAFAIHAFPFRMTPENMVRHRDDENMPFWRNLKEGYDHFEVTRRVPKVDVCERRYVFDADLPDGTDRFRPAGKCPSYEVPAAIASAVALKQSKDREAEAAILAALEEEARRERQIAARRQERQRKIAEATGMITGLFGAATEAEAPQAASATEAPAGPVETAAATPPATDAVTDVGSIGSDPQDDRATWSVTAFARIFTPRKARAAARPVAGEAAEAGYSSPILPRANPRRAGARSRLAEAGSARKESKGGILPTFFSAFTSTE